MCESDLDVRRLTAPITGLGSRIYQLYGSYPLNLSKHPVEPRFLELLRETKKISR